MLKFAEVLKTWWPQYVAAATGPIPARHWKAVEAVLTCRTERRGGHVYECDHCHSHHFCYHSCNHRSCPACGSRDQEIWAHRQQARLLPIPYYLITFTVPESIRTFFLRHPEELYPLFFDAASAAMRELCAKAKYLGGTPGFTAVLHTWTRRMLLHPHIHLVAPAVGLAPDGVSLVHPRDPEFFLPVQALSGALCMQMRSRLEAEYPALFALIPPSVWTAPWVTHCQHAGSGRSALRYLAAYVKKSAFSEQRLLGYDAQGHIMLRWRDSADGQWKILSLEPLELIRRWLLHVLPSGLMRVRHYGWLASAAWKSFLLIRFLLGMLPWNAPKPLPSAALECSRCQGTLVRLHRILPVRGPPRCREILR